MKQAKSLKSFLILLQRYQIGLEESMRRSEFALTMLIHCIIKFISSVALNHEQIKKDPQRITKIKPFINQYIWKDIDFPSHSKDWKKTCIK